MRKHPGNLPDSEVTAKVNKQIRHFWCQNDCLSKNSLPHQEVNSKHLTFENNPKKLIFHCFRRSQKNNFNQEQRLRFQPIRERARGCLNQLESTLEMKDGRRPFSQFVRFSISEFISLICFNFPKSNFKVDKLSGSVSTFLSQTSKFSKTRSKTRKQEFYFRLNITRIIRC